MSNSKDVVYKTIGKANGNPCQIIMNCVKAMNQLKRPADPKLNMSLKFLQQELSKAVMGMTFKKPRQQKNIVAVNQNVQTKH